MAAADVHGVAGLGASLDRPLLLTAPQMYKTTGSPDLFYVGAGGTARTPAWLVGNGVAEAVYGAVIVPSWWATFDATLWWANAGAGSGNVVWRIDRGVVTDGAAVPAVTSVTLAAIAAPAQNTIKTTSILTGIAVPASGLLTVGAMRVGTDGGDTLTNDVGLIGVVITRAS